MPFKDLTPAHVRLLPEGTEAAGVSALANAAADLRVKRLDVDV